MDKLEVEDFKFNLKAEACIDQENFKIVKKNVCFWTCSSLMLSE